MSIKNQAESIDRRSKIAASASLVCAFFGNARCLLEARSSTFVVKADIEALLGCCGFQIEHPRTLADCTLCTMWAALKANNVRCLHNHGVVSEDVRAEPRVRALQLCRGLGLL